MSVIARLLKNWSFIWRFDCLQFSVSPHLPAALACLPLHGFINHELYSRVEDENERGQSAVPQSSHSLIGNDLQESVYEGERRNVGRLNVMCKKKRQKKYLWGVLILTQSPSLTKYASVLGLVEVFISEPHPLQLQSGVDYPHGSGQDHVHHTCIKTRYLDNTFPSPSLRHGGGSFSNRTQVIFFFSYSY